MEENGEISTRGLKQDAVHFGELVFDVNSAYFFNHGGYEFAKQFYAEAYRAAVEIVGGEQYILSAVMHADERNRAMSEALGQDVYHYHLHVVYIPVVEKQILWTKRCKDPALVGMVKETVMQVSNSKKWASPPALDENGEPMRTKNGKVILKKSYSVLQDQYHDHMFAAGYTDVERGERGSTEEHLSVTQFKVQREEERLAAAQEQTRQAEAARIQAKAQAARADLQARQATEAAQKAEADAERLGREAEDAEDRRFRADREARLAQEKAEQAEAAATQAEEKSKRLTKETDQTEQKLKKLTGKAKDMEAYAKSVGTVDEVLPKPGLLETASSYIEKKLKPVVKKLIQTILGLYGKLWDARRENKELTARLNRSESAQDSAADAREKAEEKARKFDRLERILGQDETERLLSEHKQPRRDRQQPKHGFDFQR